MELLRVRSDLELLHVLHERTICIGLPVKAPSQGAILWHSLDVLPILLIGIAHVGEYLFELVLVVRI